MLKFVSACFQLKRKKKKPLDYPVARCGKVCSCEVTEQTNHQERVCLRLSCVSGINTARRGFSVSSQQLQLRVESQVHDGNTEEGLCDWLW